MFHVSILKNIIIATNIENHLRKNMKLVLEIGIYFILAVF